MRPGAWRTGPSVLSGAAMQPRTPVQRKTSYNKNNPAEAGLQTYILGVSLLSEKINSFVSHIGGKSLVDELLQRLRLLLFRDGAYDGVTHDIAVAVDHIGGGVGKNVCSELPASPSEAKYTFW